jgi:hypothetical protein
MYNYICLIIVCCNFFQHTAALPIDQLDLENYSNFKKFYKETIGSFEQDSNLARQIIPTTVFGRTNIIDYDLKTAVANEQEFNNAVNADFDENNDVKIINLFEISQSLESSIPILNSIEIPE